MSSHLDQLCFGPGLRIWGLGFRIWGLGFRIWWAFKSRMGLEFGVRVQVSGLGFEVLGFTYFFAKGGQ